MTAASGYFITLALLVYGGAGVIGSLLGGMGADRTLRGTLAVVLAAATSALALLCVAGSSSPWRCSACWSGARRSAPCRYACSCGSCGWRATSWKAARPCS